MMMKLLSMLTLDLPALTENTVISLRMLTHHYERCSTYYSSGHSDHGVAGDEEKRLTMVLFTRLFDALAQRVSIILNPHSHQTFTFCPHATCQKVYLNVHPIDKQWVRYQNWV